MKIFVFAVVLVLFSAVNAQDEPVPGTPGTLPPPVTTGEPGSALTFCYNGAIVNGEGADNITEVPCDFEDGKACQTKIETRPAENDVPAYFSVVRVCSSEEACNNQAANNPQKCDPAPNNIRQCFSCCTTNLCNDVLEFDDLFGA